MDKSIIKFHKRRDKRLSIRGIRLDADEEKQNNNKNNGKKSHGNTKLPFGLCKKEGIEIKDSWTPHDAWEALKGKGYDPGEEYKHLKEKGSVKKDPPKAQEKKEEKTSKEPFIEHEGKKYTKIYAEPYGYGKVSVCARDEEGREVVVADGKKAEILKKLKEAGFKKVEYDFEDLDLENWTEPKIIATINGEDYSSFTISARGDYLRIYGIDGAGRKKYVTGFEDVSSVYEYLQKNGVDTNSKDVEVDDSAKEAIKKAEEIESGKEAREEKQEKERKKIEEERAKPEYKKLGSYKKFYAKDIKVVEISKYLTRIIGTDEYGDTVDCGTAGSIDDAEDILENWGVDDYEVGRGKSETTEVFEYNGEKIRTPEIKKNAFGLYEIKADEYGKWGEIKIGEQFDTEEEARTYLKKIGLDIYKTDNISTVKISNITTFPRPTFGMRKISMIGNDKEGYKIFADTKRFGKHQQMFTAKTKEECKKWLEENNVADGNVKKIAPLPNHSIKRNHTAKSLENFDSRRESFISEDTSASDTINELTDEQKQKYTDMMSDIFNTGAYRMRRKPNHFANIIIGGRFKNLFETGTSGGSTSTRRREALAEKMFGVVGEFENKDREKYGYLGSEDDEYEVSKGNGSWYGGIIFKFKKEAVEDNSTYTMHDSLDYDAECAGYCGNKATIEGLSTCCEGELEEIYETYKKYKNGELTRDEFFQQVTTGKRSDGYLEVQYHGELTTDKIESIMFNNTDTLDEVFLDLTDARKKKLYKAMVELKIPIMYRSKDGTYSGLKSEYSDVLEYMRNKYPGIDT